MIHNAQSMKNKQEKMKNNERLTVA